MANRKFAGKPCHWRGGGLPNGKSTCSFRVYLAAWRKLARRIEKLTGLTCTGFDPDLSFSEMVKTKDQKTFTGNNVQLPVWFCEKLLAGIDKEKKL